MAYFDFPTLEHAIISAIHIHGMMSIFEDIPSR
jgi:hypothetical protein